MAETRVHGDQINFEEIFSVEKLLLSNGFIVNDVGAVKDTFAAVIGPTETYKLFSDTKVIADLTTAIYNDEPFYHSKALNDILSSEPNKQKTIKLFSNTFEWYIGQAIVKEFRGFSSAYSVKLKYSYKSEDVGDFDVLAVLRNLGLIYVECKLRKQDTSILSKTDVIKTINRSNSIHSLASIIILNAEINLEQFLNDIKYAPYPLLGWHGNVLEFPLSKGSNNKLLKWYDTYIIQSTKNFDGLIDSLRLVFQLISCSSFMKYKEVGAYVGNDTTAVEYRKMGYTVEQLIDQNVIIDGAATN
jgi:hypothetical protein